MEYREDNFSKNIHGWGWISSTGLLSSKAHVPSTIYIQFFLNLEESFQIIHDVIVKVLWKGVDGDVHWCVFEIAGRDSCKNTFSTQIFQGCFWSLTLDSTLPAFMGDSWKAWFMSVSFRLKIMTQSTKKLTIFSTRMYCCFIQCENTARGETSHRSMQSSDEKTEAQGG